ncbi:putative L-PSP endoribonuclease family protein [Coleophoma cylindrospora]|uniref:Putative L-PSP endoribonuclease family protein n=1 Tax=Coleophoma cylindrospora TaxID=1849047 RepID=A0A3D8S8Z5_9HELO|nr:putative L-PSP endoribonuclease family protein [Coleophoma cylindrospora]
MASPNGTAYFLPPTAAQGLANYPHARTTPPSSKTLFVSGISSRRGDGSYAGCVTAADGTHTLDVAEQTAAVLENIKTVINGATEGKCGWESIIDATIFLTDMKDYARMNAEWNKVWPDKSKAPARTCIQVAALPNERLCIEIKCTAVILD